MNKLILIIIAVTMAQVVVTHKEAKAEIAGLSGSLLDLRGGSYKGEMGDKEVKALVLPKEEKKGTFLIVLYLPKEKSGRIMTGEFIPEINAIGMMPRGLSASKEELEVKSTPEAIMKMSQGKLIITPQANSQILKTSIVLDYYDANTKILDKNYVGQYVLFSEKIFSSGKIVMTINSNGLVEATVNKYGVTIVGQFRIYQEIEGVAILRGVTLNQNMQTNEESKITATAILIAEDSNVRLLISSDDHPSRLHASLLLYKK